MRAGSVDEGRQRQRRRADARRPVWACVLGLGLLVAARAGAEEDHASAFAELAGGVRLGPAVRLPGRTVLSLKLAVDRQARLPAHVGLKDAGAEVTALPGPAGRWHVRVANRSSEPLLIPSGETLLTPSGPSRSVDRPVWIPPEAATFVPVVQRDEERVEGPYLSRGLGLTPDEMSLLLTGGWAERVRRRNQRLGAEEHRLDDAGAGYVTEAFESYWNDVAARLTPVADGHLVVGVAVVDRTGLRWAHLEADAQRFGALWPRLAAGLAADAWLAREDGVETGPVPTLEVYGAVREALRALAGSPLSRPTFGAGWELRWGLDEPRAAWQGLQTPGGPISLTYVRDATVDSGPRPTPSGTAGGTAPDAREEGTPGRLESGRRPRETPFEERLRERREGTDPSPSRPPPRPPAVPPGGGRPSGPLPTR